MEEKAHLDELQAQYGELQKEYESILQHQKVLEAEKKEKENHMARLAQAAIRIQKIYRGWAVRRQLSGKVINKHLSYRIYFLTADCSCRMKREARRETKRRKSRSLPWINGLDAVFGN